MLKITETSLNSKVSSHFLPPCSTSFGLHFVSTYLPTFSSHARPLHCQSLIFYSSLCFLIVFFQRLTHCAVHSSAHTATSGATVSHFIVSNLQALGLGLGLGPALMRRCILIRHYPRLSPTRLPVAKAIYHPGFFLSKLPRSPAPLPIRTDPIVRLSKQPRHQKHLCFQRGIPLTHRLSIALPPYTPEGPTATMLQSGALIRQQGRPAVAVFFFLFPSTLRIRRAGACSLRRGDAGKQMSG